MNKRMMALASAALVAGCATQPAREASMDWPAFIAAMPGNAVSRAVFSKICEPDGQFDPDGAASLTLTLLAGGEGNGAVDRGKAVVIFGAALSLLASCDGEAAASCLSAAAVDLSMALSDEILRACDTGDGASLAALYRKYRAHV